MRILFIKNFIVILFVFILFFSLSGMSCSEDIHSSQTDQIVIARVGQWTLTFGDLKRIINYYPPKQRQELLNNPKNVLKLVDRLVQARALSDLAYKTGFNNRPEIKEQLDLFLRDKLATAYVQNEVVNKIDITEDDLREYFRVHKDKYKIPSRLKIKHILIRLPSNPKGSEVKRAEARINEIMSRLKKGESFDTLAQLFSEDPGSRAKGGELGWVSVNKLDPTFAEAALKAPIGKAVGPVRSAFGLHIIMVEQRKPAQIPKYENVKQLVKKDLYNELRKVKVHSFIQSTLEDANAKVEKEKIVELLMK